jgi:hypothetical protein
MHTTCPAHYILFGSIALFLETYNMNDTAHYTNSSILILIHPLPVSYVSNFVCVLAYFSYVEKIKVGSWDHVAVCVFVCLCIPLIVARQRLCKIPLALLGSGSVKTLSR